MSQLALTSALSPENSYPRKTNNKPITTCPLWNDPKNYLGGIGIFHDLHYMANPKNNKIFSYGTYGGGLRSVGKSPELTKDEFKVQFNDQTKRLPTRYSYHQCLNAFLPWKGGNIYNQFRATREWMDGSSIEHTYQDPKHLPPNAIAANNSWCR